MDNKNPDDTYRESIRKKLGLGEKPVVEEAPMGDEIEASDEESQETLGHEAAETPEVEAKEESSPEAEAILNEVLQFVDEKEKEAGDTASKLMLKSLYLHLSKNKAKILQKMADDAQ